MAGRRKDNIWNNYVEKVSKGKTGSRAICKICKKEMQGVVQRLKEHYSKCKKMQDMEVENSPSSSTVSTSTGMYMNKLNIKT